MDSIFKPSGIRPVVFGEVLWDCFDDGTEVLGGAPFNVAWNLRGFGLDPLFVSRIGHDERGEKILDAMHRWGMDAAGVERAHSFRQRRILSCIPVISSAHSDY